MGLKERLDQQSIDALPQVSAAIESGGTYERNKMREYFLCRMTMEKKPVRDMNEAERLEIENKMIAIFRLNNWME